MIHRPAANRVELFCLASGWALFGLLAVFAPFWVIVVGAALVAVLTGLLVFGVIEPRTRSEHNVSSLSGLLARAAGAAPESSLRSAVDAAASELASLRLSEQELRKALDAVSDPILATDAVGIVRIANAAAEAFAGAAPGVTVVGRALDELFSQNALLAMHAAAAGGRAVHDQVSLHRAQGKRIYHVYAAPIGERANQASRQAVVLTLQDVTELATAVKVQTDFVANASHELRTPLAAIRAAAETIETANDDPPMVDRLTEMIRNNCTRLEDLLADLLDLSRLQSDEAPVERSRVEIDQLFADLRELFGASLEERQLTVAFERPPELSSVSTDAKSLKLILRNLIENAAKFAYEGTRVVVRVSRPAPPIVRFEVIDRGVGIPIGAQSRIFDRFFQVDASRAGTSPRRGTGLGLAMVKQAVTRLGGTVGVESVWKEGTTMIVELPFAREEAAPLR
ncbi:MAG: sensor histidine kinase [Phycisphaerales bacterium]